MNLRDLALTQAQAGGSQMRRYLLYGMDIERDYELYHRPAGTSAA